MYAFIEKIENTKQIKAKASNWLTFETQKVWVQKVFRYQSMIDEILRCFAMHMLPV